MGILKFVANVASRAFGKGGGTLAKVTDNLDRKDSVYYFAIAVRTISGVAATWLAYIAAEATGVPISEFMETMGIFTGN